MGQAEIVIASLLVAVAGLSALARRLSIPYPIVLVVGGAALSFIPGLPAIKFDPNVVLVVVLPPLVYSAAFFASLGSLRSIASGVTLNSIGLVLVTMVLVAVAAHAVIPGMGWPSSFALGAVVSPTDPLAGANIMRRLEAPRRLVSVIEVEGLFNDATALVAYRFAVGAGLGGTFSLLTASWQFVAEAVGGVAIGLIAGWVVGQVRKRTDDPLTSNTVSLLSGYAAFVPANVAGASGVLAAVTTGTYMGGRGPRIIDPQTRLQGFFVWELLVFIINASLFVLVGLQLRSVVNEIRGVPALDLALYAAAVSAAVILIRLAWFFTVPYLTATLDRETVGSQPHDPARPRAVLAWCGMRGAVSLAAALALPLTTQNGGPFPGRPMIIFLTFAVIFSTLVVQGLSLPWVIRRAGVDHDELQEQEEVRARLEAARAALAQLDLLAGEEWTRQDAVERMRGTYEYRQRRFAARAGEIEDDEGYEERSRAYQQMVQLVLGAQREALVRLRNDGEISNETMNEVIRELDLEESRLEIT